MIWLAVCALTMLAALADAACSAAAANLAGFGWSPPSPVYSDGDVVAAGSSVMLGTVSQVSHILSDYAIDD